MARFLQKLGYIKVSQRGSHAKYVLKKGDQEFPLAVPMHDKIANGTLNDILNAISKHTGIEKSKLRQMLSEI